MGHGGLGGLKDRRTDERGSRKVLFFTSLKRKTNQSMLYWE